MEQFDPIFKLPKGSDIGIYKLIEIDRFANIKIEDIEEIEIEKIEEKENRNV